MPGVPVRQGATWSRIRRVPHSKGQSKSVSQQPGSKWQSELAKTELRANFNNKKKHSQEITMQLTQKSKAGKGREVRSRVPGWRTNKWELAAEAIQV